MSEQLRAAEHLRKAADALASCTASCTTSSVSTVPRPSSLPATAGATEQMNIQALRANLFKPYTSSSTHRSRRGAAVGPRFQYQMTWSHRMFCLADTGQDWVPTPTEKRTLFLAGLGEKKIMFEKNSSPSSFKDKLEEYYPKLKNCGGVELLRVSFTNRTILEQLPVPAVGYTSKYLSEEAGLGQAICYVRPIQKDLDTTPLTETEEAGSSCMERCLTCQQEVPLQKLREHTENCQKAGEEDDNLPPMKRTSKMQTKITSTKYMKLQQKSMVDAQGNSETRLEMETDSVVLKDNKKGSSVDNDDTCEPVPCGRCPICNCSFPVSELEAHADRCLASREPCCYNLDSGQTTTKVFTEQTQTKADPQTAVTKPQTSEQRTRSWKRSLGKLQDDQICEQQWCVDIIRQQAARTLFEELEEATEQNWRGKVLVRFDGELAIDAGGPRREVFSLLFGQCDLFEGEFFKVTADFLNGKKYKLLGKAVAYALVFGHPGPQRLHKSLAKYILTEQTPEDDEICVQDAEVSSLMKQIEECPDDDTLVGVRDAAVDALVTAKFSKVLNIKTKPDALLALRQHYGFNQYIVATRQFMEGLDLHGVLTVMKNHPEDATSTLIKLPLCVEKIKGFFTPLFTEPMEEPRKSREQVVVYNFYRYLKQVSNGKIVRELYDMDSDTTITYTMRLEDVIRVLVGSDDLPLDKDQGLLEFDNGEGLPRFNTCAPSVIFHEVSKWQDYSEFEQKFTYSVVGSKNYFGKAW